MKKPEDYYKETLLFCEGNNGGIQRFKRLVLETIKQAQIDAIDATVKLCAEKATTMDDPRSYCGNTGSEYPPDTIVNSQSILNCAEILKKEL